MDLQQVPRHDAVPAVDGGGQDLYPQAGGGHDVLGRSEQLHPGQGRQRSKVREEQQRGPELREGADSQPQEGGHKYLMVTYCWESHITADIILPTTLVFFTDRQLPDSDNSYDRRLNELGIKTFPQPEFPVEFLQKWKKHSRLNNYIFNTSENIIFQITKYCGYLSRYQYNDDNVTPQLHRS